MSDTIPFYRLRDMIIKRYGEGRFALGYSIVARWLSFELKRPVIAEYIEMISNATNADEVVITIREIQALQKLFGFKTYHEFFSFPEQMTNNLKPLKV